MVAASSQPDCISVSRLYHSAQSDEANFCKEVKWDEEILKVQVTNSDLVDEVNSRSTICRFLVQSGARSNKVRYVSNVHSNLKKKKKKKKKKTLYL